MRVGSEVARGMAPVSHADAGMEETTETPLQYAVTKMAGLIAPRHLASGGESAAGHPVDDLGLKHYVRASLGMEVRVQVPVINVPFRLIFAYNPNAREDQIINGFPFFFNEKKKVIRFSVGRTF